MKILEVGYEKRTILELTRNDMITICNALYGYAKHNDHNEELVKEINGIRKVLRTAVNICESGQPLIEQTMKLIEKH